MEQLDPVQHKITADIIRREVMKLRYGQPLEDSTPEMEEELWRN